MDGDNKTWMQKDAERDARQEALRNARQEEARKKQLADAERDRTRKRGEEVSRDKAEQVRADMAKRVAEAKAKAETLKDLRKRDPTIKPEEARKVTSLSDARTVGERNAAIQAVRSGASPQQSVDAYRKLLRDGERVPLGLRQEGAAWRQQKLSDDSRDNGPKTTTTNTYSPSSDRVSAPTIYKPFEPYFTSGGVGCRFGMVTIPNGNLATRLLVGTESDPDSWGANYIQIPAVSVPVSGVTSVYIEVVVDNIAYPGYTYISSTYGTQSLTSHGKVPATQTSNNVDVSPPNGATETTLKIPLFSIGSDGSLFQWRASNIDLTLHPMSGTNDTIDAGGTDTYFFDNGYLDPIP